MHKIPVRQIMTLQVVTIGPDRHVRLEAVRSLDNLGNREAEGDLLKALRDEDAEIRVRAAKALLSFLTKEETITTIVGEILLGGMDKVDRDHLVNAIRLIDPERDIAGEILSKELTGEDRDRADAARGILIDLGGWTAIQKLGQRRSTLETLDKLLGDSEKVVKSTFDETMRQARINFYFAMGVNVLVVVVGLALIIIAIRQLVIDPNLIQSWLVPGGAGVIGVILNLGFNNPRKNAREDLAALLNVHTIFLGYLRQLNQIDATFKHEFIENERFTTDDMSVTVREIDQAMIKTLRMAGKHLYLPLRSGDGDQDNPEEKEKDKSPSNI